MCKDPVYIHHNRKTILQIVVKRSSVRGSRQAAHGLTAVMCEGRHECKGQSMINSLGVAGADSMGAPVVVEISEIGLVAG